MKVSETLFILLQLEISSLLDLTTEIEEFYRLITNHFIIHRVDVDGKLAVSYQQQKDKLMKKLLFTVLLALILGGCLNTENHRVKIRRDIADIESGISIVNTETVWWRTPYYKDTPRDKNPWLKFVHPQDDQWYDPWGQDPLSNYGVLPLSEQIRRLGPPKKEVEPGAKLTDSDDVRNEALKLLQKRLEERSKQEVY